ncbi:hypothetical protein CROQUDRAFT_51230 [Cronartium quercuum f. sp. fusiforme G11]|uniref:RlpA-like protein double-psi beta-barrel domain-containing protein n=1 Tax=Cronartium quercuum f. sp. fusiforme G11 TaxID=708437 RepID=A0A9P6N8W8_9BASI|nr:hypothetical protein CROQUDRAFT_51230 [Cronartium quercuum f. sp. fusiforme G11]
MSIRPCALVQVVFFLASLHAFVLVRGQEKRETIVSDDESVIWIPIVSHGLMLTHTASPVRASGPPLIEAAREEEATGSIFSPVLSGSSPPLVSWDEALAGELADMPWRRRSLTGPRDIVKRAGVVRLIRRVGAKGPDELEFAVTSEPNMIHSRRLVDNGSGSDEHRMVRKATLKRREKDAKTDIVNSFTKASKEIGEVMKGATIRTTITWYTGHDLLNPYCARKTKWAPTDESLVIAVTQKWSQRPACGEFLEISIPAKDGGRKGKSVIARVVDLCGGCKPEVSHADLSKAAFTKLFNLDVGIVSGLAMRKVAPPKMWSNKLYGPRIL